MIDIYLLDSSYIAVWAALFGFVCLFVSLPSVWAIRRAQLLRWSLVARPTAPGDLLVRIGVVGFLATFGPLGFLAWISTRAPVIADLEQTAKLVAAAFAGSLLGALVGTVVGRSGARAVYLRAVPSGVSA